MMLRVLLIKRFHRTNPTTIEWNKTIRSHQINGNPQQALKMFQLGIEKNAFQPNSVTYLTIIDVCKQLNSLPTLKIIHQLIEQSNKSPVDAQEISDNPRIRSLLMDAYIKCDDLNGAFQVFQSMKHRNNVDYAALMTGFNKRKEYEQTWQIAKDTPLSIIKSSPIVATLILQACTNLDKYENGHKLHQHIVQWVPKDRILMNELLNFYLKFNNEKEALDIFQRHLNYQTVVEYSLLMKYFIRRYKPEKAIELYWNLLKNTRIQPDHIIYVLMSQAIANGCCLHSAKKFHEQIKKSSSHIDTQNALINMYGNNISQFIYSIEQRKVELPQTILDRFCKLGDLDQAVRIFQTMTKHNLVSYNTLLSLYGLHRQGDKALQCYKQLYQQGHRPDGKTFVLLLQALSRTPANIDESKKIFLSIDENQRGPVLTAAMISALIRAELFNEAKEILKKFPKEKILFHAIKANIKSKDDLFEYPIEITNESLAMFDLLMNNIFIYAGITDQIQNVSEQFSNNEHLQRILSYSYFENSNGEIEYFQGTHSPMQTCEHTEKLALARAVEDSQNSSIPILIGKNHRVCRLCFDHFQQISKSYSTKNIYLRDSTGFYRFVHGSCSSEIFE